MYFDSFSQFWQMGGYGFFVWLSFGVSLFTLIILALDATMDKKRLFKLVQSEVLRKSRIKAAHIASQAQDQEK
ncbi:MAG: heme exporter protein D [Paraglaciecola sp.]|jgi:heme exporter protein D